MLVIVLSSITALLVALNVFLVFEVRRLSHRAKVAWRAIELLGVAQDDVAKGFDALTTCCTTMSDEVDILHSRVGAAEIGGTMHRDAILLQVHQLRGLVEKANNANFETRAWVSKVLN